MSWTDFSYLIGTGGENVRIGVPKDLYMCESFQELEEKVVAEEIKFPPGSTVQENLSTLNELCLAGVTADMGKDEELAFLHYSRYLTAYIMFSQMDEYKTDDMMRKIDENSELVKRIVVTLKQSLTARYESLQIGRLQIEMKIRQILQQHVYNLDAEIVTSRNLKKARDELRSLGMVMLMVETDCKQQQQESTSADADNVPEQLKCPVCFEIFQEQVFQCINGHSICSNCYNAGEMITCPECRVHFIAGHIRNRAIEGLVSTWMLDCPFKERGCTQRVLCKHMTQHVEGCCYGKSEEHRQLFKVRTEYGEKLHELKNCETASQEAFMQRLQTEATWRKLEADNNPFLTKVLETVVNDLNLRAKEQEVRLEIRLNGFQNRTGGFNSV